MNKLEYIKDSSTGIETVSYENVNISYPEHTHIGHIIKGEQTDGKFSYHLVRIAPGKSIKNHIHKTQLETHEVIAGSGICINDGTEIKYEHGVISIIPAAIPHEVNAGDEGLYLFAKFMPALC